MSRSTPHIAILAGGAGTRFWPAGRRTLPKQALALSGDDPRPLLELTLARVGPLSTQPPWLVAPAALRDVLQRAAGRGKRSRFLVEPVPKNTAAAVALAAYEVAARDADGVVLIVPADHYVEPVKAYVSALRAMCARAARCDALLTLGLEPTRPATGYGWLALGEQVAGTSKLPVLKVARFVEKPALAKARRFLSGGRHLWNGGTFAFRAQVFLDQLARHLPEVADPLRKAYERHGTRRFDAALRRAYQKLPSISVDHGVMERADKVEVVRAAFQWDDLGSWDAVGRHRTPDAQGNAIRGGATLVDSSHCVVDAGDGHVALLGVRDLIVVRTGDTVLVAKRGEGEAVRQVVERLRQAGREDLLR